MNSISLLNLLMDKTLFSRSINFYFSIINSRKKNISRLNSLAEKPYKLTYNSINFILTP